MPPEPTWPETLERRYQQGFEAGVQAERERSEARIEGLRLTDYACHEEPERAYNRAIDAALAVVTGKEGTEK
jgi:hypothetical protein